MGTSADLFICVLQLSPNEREASVFSVHLQPKSPETALLFKDCPLSGADNMHKAQPGEKMAAEQQSMTTEGGVAESHGSNTAPASGGDSMADTGTGRRAEDISAAKQDYIADKEAAHSSHQTRSHHGSGTGLEQQDPHAAAVG